MKKKIIPVLFVLVLIILIGAVAVGLWLKEKYSYSNEVLDLQEYFQVKNGERAILLGNDRLEEKALVENDVCYLTLSQVRRDLNEIFYVDEEEGLLLYTDAETTMEARMGETGYYTDGVKTDTPYVIYMQKGGKSYLALDFVKLFTNFEYRVYDYWMQLTTSWDEKNMIVASGETKLRQKGGIKSPILADVSEGDELEILERMTDWCKVKTADSLIGYVENKMLGEEFRRTPVPVTDYVEPEYTNISLDKKVSLGWHSVGGIGGNASLDNMVAGTKGLNVIAPTWFSLIDSEGGMRSFGETSYVDRAHQLGLQVWGVLDDFNYELETGTPISCYSVLSSTSNRRKLEQTVIDEALRLGLDGINLDFEQLSEECGVHYAQFLRELSVLCRKNRLILSADNKVPYHYNEYQCLDVQSVVADYVIIMGYDEHWHKSGNPGSVASIDYVTGGLEKTLEKVPANKVINGLPLYTLVWKIDGATVTDEILSIANTPAFLQRINKKPEWDNAACQNYLEWTSGNATYKVWLEDAESIRMKLNVMIANKIGGAAVWRLGYGTPAIWELINAFTSS
ncbi:MAG: glycosyl hydrolase family 18 protein [Acetatifactor sp.]|nr:glycosyl hydrolase family 18 protein [Acetatifactor sp.]